MPMFLGQQTIADLKDLVKAKDYTVKQIEDARKAFSWTGPDADEWDSDWRIFKVKYDAARLLAGTAIGSAAMMVGVSDDIIPAQTAWDAILASLRHQEGVQTKGDLQDLVERLAAAGKNVDFSQTPQPTHTDVDTEILKRVPPPPKPPLGKDWTPWLVGGGVVTVFGLAWLFRPRFPHF